MVIIWILLVSTVLFDPVIGFCRDEMSYNDCLFYRKLGMCEVEEYKPTLSKKCPMSCNLCDYGLDRMKHFCVDRKNGNHCQFLKMNGACETHINIMAEGCPRTCNLCDVKDKCSKLNCNNNQICVLDEQRNAQCVCPSYCPNESGYKRLGKVCGSDNKMYHNLCDLRAEACRAQHNITVNKYGICSGQEPCSDSQVEKENGLCNDWKAAGYCGNPEYSDTMRTFCKRTCGHCPDPSKASIQPLHKCEKSRYGCCWDFTNKPAPPAQCPKCFDYYPNICQSFLQSCNSLDRNNIKFMKLNCPVTCGLCIPDERQKHEIRIIYKYGRKSFEAKIKIRND